MSEKERLKFSVHIERKIQTHPYESAAVGYWREFYQDEVSEEYAYSEVSKQVDEWIRLEKLEMKP